jgi:hypothetical protein
VNAITTLTVYFKTTSKIAARGSLIITLPPEITPQTGPTCSMSAPIVGTTIPISCSLSGQDINVLLTNSGVSISADTYCEIKISPFKNPSSTTLTSSF